MCPTPVSLPIPVSGDARTRPKHRAFEFRSAGISGRTISLGYALSGGPDPDVSFTETLELPASLPLPGQGDAIARELLDGMHRMFGISYYKAAVPARLVAAPVSELDARFWDQVYTEGLGEFYYTNQITPPPHEGFPRGGPPSEFSERDRVPARPEKALVLVGGGKDSAVTREIVRHAGVDAVAFSLGSSPWIARSVSAMDMPHLTVARTLDPNLANLNRRGAWNGHIPISACIASIATFVAYLGGYTSVIAGNESSADDENVKWQNISVNHQWSKGRVFEEQFARWCSRHMQDGPLYFSLLRPLTELRIAEAFAVHSNYFDDFTSCNRNFRLVGAATSPRWCGVCPKCVFVYLMLAPCLDEDRMGTIFGANFLANPSNADLLERLAGVSGFKPFECVGTAEETRAALLRLDRLDRLPRSLRPWYASTVTPLIPDPDGLLEKLRTPGGPHHLPAIWEQRLHAYLATHPS